MYAEMENQEGPIVGHGAVVDEGHHLAAAVSGGGVGRCARVIEDAAFEALDTEALAKVRAGRDRSRGTVGPASRSEVRL